MVDRDLIVIEETAAAGKYRQRRVGLMERWMRDEVIEPRHHAAATHYAFVFEAASLRGRYYTLDMERVARSMPDNDGAISHIVDAKRRINKAMAVPGKFAGDAIWSVIGEDMSLQEYATGRATSGRPISGNLIYVATEKGTPFMSAKSFSQWLVKARKAAKLPNECVPKVAATRLAEAGVGEFMLMSIMGWTNPS